MTWQDVRLEAVAPRVSYTVDPRSFGDQLVEHYSIPSLDETGQPEVVRGADIMSTKQLLRGGEVMVSRLNPRKARVVAVPTVRGVAVASGEFVIVSPSRVEPRFLTYLLLSEGIRQYLDSRVQSVTRSHQRIRPEVLLKMRIRVPASSEQRAIADYLDSEISRIDTLITKKRHMIELLEESDRSTIDDLFQGVSQHGLVRLGHLAEVRSGLTLGGAKTRSQARVTLPYLRVANVKHDRLDLTEVKSVTVDEATARRTALRNGDVLMTEGGDIDKLGRGTVWSGEIDPCLHQNHVFAVRMRTRNLLPEFLALLTRTSYARRYFEMTGVRSTNLASTNSSKVADFRISLPSPSTQSRLVSTYQHKWDALEETRVAMGKQLDLLNERRQGLITSAVMGNLPVPHTAI